MNCFISIHYSQFYLYSSIKEKDVTVAQNKESRHFDGFQNLDNEGIMAERTGLEPATSNVTGWRSNQLNYRSQFDFQNLVGTEGLEPPTSSL